MTQPVSPPCTLPIIQRLKGHIILDNVVIGGQGDLIHISSAGREWRLRAESAIAAASWREQVLLSMTATRSAADASGAQGSVIQQSGWFGAPNKSLYGVLSNHLVLRIHDAPPADSRLEQAVDSIAILKSTLFSTDSASLTIVNPERVLELQWDPAGQIRWESVLKAARNASTIIKVVEETVELMEAISDGITVQPPRIEQLIMPSTKLPRLHLGTEQRKAEAKKKAAALDPDMGAPLDEAAGVPATSVRAAMAVDALPGSARATKARVQGRGKKSCCAIS